MMDGLFLELMNIMLPVILTAGIGYVWVRRGAPFDAGLTGTLGAFIAVPCLIFSSLTTMNLSLDDAGQMAGMVFAAIVLMTIIGWLALTIWGKERRSNTIAISLPNMGNMGVPICYFAFGEKGLVLAVICMMVLSLVTFSAGLMVVGGRDAWKDVFRLPNTWALVAALVFVFTDWTPPVFVANFTEFVGGMALPLMLVTLGASIAGFGLTHLREAIGISILRFAIGIAVAVGLVMVVDTDPVIAGVLITQCAMPVAVFNVVLARRYGRDPEKVAGITLITTLASFAVLPVVLSLIL